MTEWAPAAEAEAAMRDALRADDQELYFRILARMELLLPISADATTGRAPMGWGTWTVGDRTHVLAFTSSEAMHACLATHAGSARRIAYYELAAAWPNLEWWLAVNPGLPIEGYLPAWFVSQLARGDVRLPGRAGGAQARKMRAETLGRARVPAEPAPAPPPPVLPAQSTEIPAAEMSQAAGMWLEAPPNGLDEPVPPPATPEPMPDPAALEPSEPSDSSFTPANDLEAHLAAAANSGRPDTFLSVLLLAKVLLPVADGADPAVRPGDPGFAWRTEKQDDLAYVPVFSSRERLAEHLPVPVDAIGIRFMQLIKAWPDDAWSLVVNPGTPIGATLPGSQIAGLVSSAVEVGLDDDAGEAGEFAADAAPAAVTDAEAPVPMQKVVAPSQVGWYLDRGYDRVSGFVHRAQEVAHLRAPATLVAGLGLGSEGSPFDSNADDVYVLRWMAYCPNLYRIPYGGRTEAAMGAMEGWVIERAPFRGNGFAPADSGDVIAEFKVDSIRLPHGAELWRLSREGGSKLVALLDADGPAWQRVGGAT